MAQLLSRRIPYICKSCQLGQVAQNVRPIARAYTSTARRCKSLREQLEERSNDGNVSKPARPSRGPEHEQVRQQRHQQTASLAPVSSPSLTPNTSHTSKQRQTTPDITQLQRELRLIQEEVLGVLESDLIPENSMVRNILQKAQTLSDTLLQPGTETTPTDQISTQSGDHIPEAHKPPSLTPSIHSTIALPLVKGLYTLLEDPKLYISEDLLTSYVHIATSLYLPRYLPQIFHLYAHKPIPTPNTHNPIKYTDPWSRHPKYAISPALAAKAITSAIAARDMPLAISLIDTTVATPQFQTSKFLRRALIPLSAAGSVVPLSYAISTRAADWQLTWDSDTFFWMCMAGSGAYLGTMATLLLITVTAWNDHHKRVRWVPGTPLGSRWFREEERFWFDRIALSWGFLDENRHGEEMGEEWEALREVCGVRYLEVDRSSLLPGML